MSQRVKRIRLRLVQLNRCLWQAHVHGDMHLYDVFLTEWSTCARELGKIFFEKK